MSEGRWIKGSYVYGSTVSSVGGSHWVSNDDQRKKREKQEKQAHKSEQARAKENIAREKVIAQQKREMEKAKAQRDREAQERFDSARYHEDAYPSLFNPSRKVRSLEKHKEERYAGWLKTRIPNFPSFPTYPNHESYFWCDNDDYGYDEFLFEADQNKYNENVDTYNKRVKEFCDGLGISGITLPIKDVNDIEDIVKKIQAKDAEKAEEAAVLASIGKDLKKLTDSAQKTIEDAYKAHFASLSLFANKGRENPLSTLDNKKAHKFSR